MIGKVSCDAAADIPAVASIPPDAASIPADAASISADVGEVL